MLPQSTTDRPKPDPRPLTVVVADDHPATREALEGWLRDLGHHVHGAATGAEAIRLLERHGADLVVTEVLLPNGDGLEVINALKRHRPDGRSLAISGGGRYLSAAECLRVAKGLGASDVLPKPLSREQFLDAIARVMSDVRPADRRVLDAAPAL